MKELGYEFTNEERDAAFEAFKNWRIVKRKLLRKIYANYAW